jgi:hypothetical protein
VPLQLQILTEQGFAVSIQLVGYEGQSVRLWQSTETIGANQTGMDAQRFGFRFQYIINPVQKLLIAKQHLFTWISYCTQIEVGHPRFYGEGAGVMPAIGANYWAAAWANAKSPLFGFGDGAMIKLSCFNLLCHRSMHAFIDMSLSYLGNKIHAAPERENAGVRRVNAVRIEGRKSFEFRQ